MKKFKGKALYEPTGKAAEYSPWAVNYYTGCSNDCEYCYCKRGVLSHVWDNKPHLKKCFIDEADAIKTFVKEAEKNYYEIEDKGILLSFSTDPLLPETRVLTLDTISVSLDMGIPVKVLTKRTDWFDYFLERYSIESKLYEENKDRLAFGFTLTGFDEKEPNACSNFDRTEIMQELHNMGFKVWASIEPIITPAMSLNMIQRTQGYCDLYKIGLMSGIKKDFYNDKHLHLFFNKLSRYPDSKFYLKDSFVSHLGIDRKTLAKNFVGADYNIFDSDNDVTRKS